jgi:8-oxo-dGTP pyrophosphatase MutT (NUDIX family)
MSKPQRIAAGGFIFKGDRVLLVRYPDQDGGTYLVGPGGGLEQDENVIQAIVREVQEETAITVAPRGLVAIEDLLTSRYKMIKVWMVCDYVAGEVCATQAAKEEGIIEAGWFTKEELASKVVYPSPLMQHDWEEFRAEEWQVEILPTREVRF